MKNKKLEQLNKESENKLKIAEQLIERSQQEIETLCEQLKAQKLVDKIETKRQQLVNLKQKLLSSIATESELNNFCQLQKELAYLEQQQSQIETKILQVELPKF